MAQKAHKVVLITGVASGIGQATARVLSTHGYAVYGGSRRTPHGADADGVQLMRLDVRSEASVDAGVERVLREQGRIDVLVNNAGFVTAGALEEFTLEEAQAVLDTNFWGAVRMTAAVLPTMRAQGSGQIINVTSIGGLVGKPFWGFYVASKFALEGYSESLRYEVAPLGISVSVVEPGGVKTEFWRAQQTTQRRIDAYDWSRERVQRAEREFEHASSEPELVARRILDIVRCPSPRLRHSVGRDAAMICVMRRFMPEPLFEAGLKRMFHLNSKPADTARRLAAAVPAEQGA